jgi:hypothetical protein
VENEKREIGNGGKERDMKEQRLKEIKREIKEQRLKEG